MRVLDAQFSLVRVISDRVDLEAFAGCFQRAREVKGLASGRAWTHKLDIDAPGGGRWLYDSSTGDFTVLSMKHTPVYRLEPEDRDRVAALLVAERLMLPQQAKSTAEPRAALEPSAEPFASLNRKGAEAALKASAPEVVWRDVIELDLDGDGRMDFVLLGRTPSEAVVGVVFGASLPSPVVLRFRRDAASQRGICGDPGDARLSVEALSAPDDPDDGPPAEARAPAGSLRKGFRLDSGDCDAFHFFFDGKGVKWWRR